MGRPKKTRLTKKSLIQEVIDLFSAAPNTPLNYKQIAAKLSLQHGAHKQLLNTVLYELVDMQLLEEIYRGKFKFRFQGAYIQGTVDMTASGSAYIISNDAGNDVFVSRENLMNALHGDEVKVYVFARRKGRKMEGEVVEIIQRARETFVGTIERSERYAFLVSDSKNMPFDIFLPLYQEKPVKHGYRAIVRIVEWPKRAKNPVGEIVELLGKAGEHESEIHTIMAEFELPYHFTKEVEEAAEDLSDLISDQEIAQRKDFRSVTCFTIDPEDAKDFDDALSIEYLEDGRYRIGVHIADVTHYVKPDSILEKEAQRRATSVYLVDRVVPMLPEKLSNQVCSLRPNEDKLTFSAVFEMDDQAKVYSEWFGRTIIHSQRRFSYEEAQQVIDSGDGDLSRELTLLNTLAQTMRQQRFKQGAIAFDRIELKFKIDEQGKPTGVYERQHGTANELIEEFMLLANRKVAEWVHRQEKGSKARTFVYRIHDKPDPEKLSNFTNFIQRFGYVVNPSEGESTSHSINRILDQVEGKPEQNIIETLAVRAMAKAVYSTKNIGHYGLSFPHYTHFTSPIRRYPDMMVHRLLHAYLEGAKSFDVDPFERQCKHASFQEQQAAMAERASIKFKAVEFMQDKVGMVFDGIISGVTDWGLYVEIVENKIEGMVPIREIDDDFYYFDESEYSLIGQRKGKVFRLGDSIRVIINRTNLIKKQIDMLLAMDE